jgi:hypothetical protein
MREVRFRHVFVRHNLYLFVTECGVAEPHLNVVATSEV